jgi:hypothetical protein
MTAAGPNALVRTTRGERMPATPEVSTTEPPSATAGVRARLEAALDESIDGCARCKVCDTQIGAAMTVLGPLLARAEAAEATLAALRDVLLEGGQDDASVRRRALAIIGPA